MQTRGYGFFLAPASADCAVAVVEVLQRLTVVVTATVAGYGRTVFAQAPEVFPAQVRGRFRRPDRGRGLLRYDQRDGRVVDRNLVAAVTRIEIARRAAGRRVRFASVRRFRFASSAGRPSCLVRQFGRWGVLDAAAGLPAAVHARQRIVSGRTAGRVHRLLDRRSLVRVTDASADAARRRSRVGS